jgi:aconitate hydratase
VFDVPDLDDNIKPRQKLTVVATRAATGSAGGSPIKFPATLRIDTPVELDYYRNGGILHTVLRKLLKS